jgi:hypothetical protein
MEQQPLKRKNKRSNKLRLDVSFGWHEEREAVLLLGILLSKECCLPSVLKNFIFGLTIARLKIVFCIRNKEAGPFVYRLGTHGFHPCKSGSIPWLQFN